MCLTPCTSGKSAATLLLYAVTVPLMAASIVLPAAAASDDSLPVLVLWLAAANDSETSLPLALVLGFPATDCPGFPCFPLLVFLHHHMSSFFC
jgi:hypothetical protein